MPQVWAVPVLVREERSVQMTNFIHRQIRKQADGAVKSEGRTTKCRHANTGLPHNPECGCGWASQSAPYAEHPYDDCAADCWECREQWWWHQERADKNRERNR